MREKERYGERYRHEDEPLGHGNGFAGKYGESHDTDNERVVQVDGIRYFRHPFERPVVEQPADFFRIRYGEQSDAEEYWHEREAVRSCGPGIREVVGFPDGPEKIERPEHRREERRVEPVRMFQPLHLRVYRHSADGHAEEEMQSEQEGVVRGKPYRYGTFSRRKGEFHEREMSREEDSGRDRESCPRVFPRHFDYGSHDRYHRQSSEHVERDIPERSVEVRGKKRGRVSPAEERETRQNPPERVIHPSPNEEYRQKRERESDVIRGGDSQKPVDERVFRVGRRRSFVNRAPIRRRAEHSSEDEEEAHGDRPSFHELVKVPIPLGQIVDGALLVEVVAYYAQASQGPEARESGEVLRHGSNLS